MSQNIINPDRRDPSRIRNKADIGLSRVDNVSVSDILDITKDLVRDEVYSGDRYAERELDMGVPFEIPLCMFTDNSTKLSITVSFLKGNEILSNITAHVSHSYDTDYRDPFEIEFDSLDNLVLNSENFVSFYFYEKKDNKQSVLSLRGDGNTLNKTYGITAVSYYFSDYIVISNDKEEHFSFRKLTNEKILVGDEVGKYYQSSVKKVEYKPSQGDRSKTSTAKSLSVYDSSDDLIYDNTLNLLPNQVDGYSFPTINEVPFTGSRDINILTDEKTSTSTRNITIYAQHSGSSSDEAGVHKWEVLEDTRVVASNNNTTNGTSVFSKKSKDAEKEGYGLCRMVGEKLYQKQDSSNSLGELQNITNSLNTLKGYNDSSVSFGLLQKYLTSICTILTDIIGSSGNVSIEFGEGLEENNIKNPYTYFGISPTIGKIIRVHYKLICPEKCFVKGIISRPPIYNDYLITVKIEGDDSPKIINSDGEYGVIFYDGLDKTEISGDGKAIKTGVIEFTTTRFPSFEPNLSWGEENYLNVSYRTEKDSSNEIPLLTIPIHLKSLNINNIFYSNSSATSVFNPIILTRLGRYSYTENAAGATELTSLDYSENFLANGCENDYESSHCLWKNNNVDIDNINKNAQKSITTYGIILPPKQFIKRLNNEGITYLDYLLVEGYSLSRYIKLELICPEKDKTLGDFFEDFNILIKGTSGDDLFGVLRSSGTNGSERTRFQNSSHYIFNFELPISLDVKKTKRSQNITSLDNNSKTIVNTVFEYSSLDSRIEDHSYSQLTPKDIIEQDTGFSSEEDLHSSHRFYLLLYPKNSTHKSSSFDILDLQKNPYIKITACNCSRSSSDFTEVFGNEININFSQNRFPLVLENVNTSSSENTYGVYSSLRFRAAGNNPHDSAYFYEDYNNIGVEELKIPVTFYDFYEGSGYNDKDKIYSNENDKKYSDLVGSKNFELLTGLSGGTVSSRISTGGDNLSIYGNYIKIKSNSIQYSHSGQIDPVSSLRPTEHSHYNFIRNFKLTNEDIKKIYDAVNKGIWVGRSSRDSYPKEFLPDFNKITNIEYPLSLSNPNILGVSSSTPARRKTIIFSLQRMAISNYSPILGGIECPSQFIHYRKNDSADYTRDNEKFPENLMGTGRYYKVDCSKRTWGANKIDNIEESDVILRLSNLLVNFGFAFNIAGNFSGSVVILGKLKVTAPKINTEADSDYDKFCKFDGKYKSSFSFYGAENKRTYREDLNRLKKYASDAFKGKDSYSWEMYTKTEIYLNETWKSSQSYMGSELTSDDYGEITTARKYSELNKKTERLIFYPQNQKDFEKESDPWKRAELTKYSVLNLNVNCRYDNPDTSLTAEINENLNPHSDVTFPQSSALFPNNEIWNDLVNIYPRMTTMRPVTEPTTLELTLEFYYQNAGEKIPVDVNNGIDNNKLTFKFDLWPEGHSGETNRNYYGVIVN